jgi:hypothetical protein
MERLRNSATPNGYCAPQLPRSNPAWSGATELIAATAVDTLYYLAYLLIA